MYLYFERYAIVHFHGIHTSGVIPVDSVTLTSKLGSFRNMAASLVRLLILQARQLCGILKLNAGIHFLTGVPKCTPLFFAFVEYR